MEELEILKKDNEDLAKYVVIVLKIMQVKADKYNAVNNSEFEKAASFRDQERKLIESLPADSRMEELVVRYQIKVGE